MVSCLRPSLELHRIRVLQHLGLDVFPRHHQFSGLLLDDVCNHDLGHFLELTELGLIRPEMRRKRRESETSTEIHDAADG